MAVNSQVIKELLENGTHFGHQTNKWNPKMKKYIFGEKSGIYIIDLEKTEQLLAKAEAFLEEVSRRNEKVIFVGTKKQAKEIIREEAERSGMFYVDERWLGGTLTNFATIRKSVDRMNHLEEMKSGEIYNALAKKEKVKLEREEMKLLRNLKGIRGMVSRPAAIIVVDAEDEKIAVREAYKVGIPIVALMDTNSDPDMITYPIPGNDDAVKSIRYICSKLAGAILRGSGVVEVKNKVVEKISEKPAEKPVAEIKKEEIKKEEAPAQKEQPAEVKIHEEKKKEEHKESKLRAIFHRREPKKEEKKEEVKEEKAKEEKKEDIEGDISLG